MIGATVSRHRILAKLGGGGFGIAYGAEDPERGDTKILDLGAFFRTGVDSRPP